jgi:hypothetical protein
MLSGRQHQQQEQSFSDSYTALILEEVEKLYNELTTKLTNGVIAAVADIRASSSPLSLPPAQNPTTLSYLTTITNSKIKVKNLFIIILKLILLNDNITITADQ